MSAILDSAARLDKQRASDLDRSDAALDCGHMPEAVSEEHMRLFKFYGVNKLSDLADAQSRHIEKLQAKLPPTPSLAPQRVREG